MFISLFGFSQDGLEFNCYTDFEIDQNEPHASGNSLYKPCRNGEGEYFKALVVFVQFENDERNNQNWPLDELPIWAEDFIDDEILTEYTDLSLSDFWQEMSGSEFDFIGDVYPELVILPSETYYIQNNKDFGDCNLDVFEEIDPNVDFSLYDNWELNNGEFVFTEGDADGLVDMIIMIYRTPGAWFGGGYGGFDGIAMLGNNTFVTDDNYPSGQYVSINGGLGSSGSGLTMRTGLSGHLFMLGITTHEFGHTLFGYVHYNYGGLMGGGTTACNGWELFKLGYAGQYVANSNGYQIWIGDMISDGHLLKIPVPLSNPSSTTYFLVENHQKVSHYDQIIRGGPAGGGWDFTDLGSGIYVWLVKNGTSSSPTFDLIVADGRWNWSYQGDFYAPGFHVGSACEDYVPKFLNYAVNRDLGASDRMYSTAWCGYSNAAKWCDINPLTKEWELTRDRLGDEYDAFNFGYNELISPWSNPSSYINSSNNMSIQLKDESGDDIKVAVYDTYQSSLSLPPSKPQKFWMNGHNNYHPNLFWTASIEPDLSKYKIYRVIGQQEVEPTNFSLIATIDAFEKGEPVTSYTDETININNQGDLAVYYRITAVDSSTNESVPSNYDWLPYSWTPKISVNNNFSNPFEYSLCDNYPNPFNPTTTINYSIQLDGFVSLKVYDILGREVASLVNENKPAGFYSIEFDATELPSGIYLYKLASGKFNETKKLVLMK